MDKNRNNKIFNCDLCFYNCKRKFQLNNHYKECHPSFENPIQITNTKYQKCDRPGCTFSSISIDELVTHFATIHNMQMEKITLKFQSLLGK
jgi:hypothetical protein